MKHKIFMILFFALLSSGSFAQTTVDFFINGTKAGQLILKADENTGSLSYQKSIYRKIDRLSIEIHGKSVDGGYYRKVEVIGDEMTPMFVASETVGATGQFILTDKSVLKRLKKGKPITLYVEKTPANTKSKEAVTKVYLGTLTREK
jgi:hypothetical protein